MRRVLWVVLLAAMVATASHAQIPREFPAGATLGVLTGGGQRPFPLLQIGDKLLRLAAGGRIIDENNRVITHNFLPAQAYVLFVADMNGDISRLYILRPDELERIKQQAQAR